MKYMGSKNRIAKHILPIILKNRKEGQCYVEPFVGGANMIDKVPCNRLGADSNITTIQALEVVRDKLHTIPKNNTEFTEAMYMSYREESKQVISHPISFVGYAYSYGAKWFGGWRRDNTGRRDYVQEAYNNAVKQHPNLQGVILYHSQYDELSIPINSIIYCDPPYKNTTGYKQTFNHDKFYDWCRAMAREGHTIYISEYNMPEDFICVWEKEVNSSLTRDTGGKKGVEKLYTYKVAE